MPNMPNFSQAEWAALGVVLTTVLCAFPVLALVYGVLLNLDTRRYTVEPAMRRQGRTVFVLCLAGVLLAFSSGLFVRGIGLAALLFYGLLEVLLVAAMVLTGRFLRQPLRRPLRLASGALLTSEVLLALCLPVLLMVANLAQKSIAYSNFNEAGVRAALRKNPNDPAAHSSLAQIDSLHRDHAGAIAEWRQVLAVEPDNEMALYMLGSELTRAHQTEMARPLYQRLAAQNGTFSGSARRWLARHGG